MLLFSFCAIYARWVKAVPFSRNPLHTVQDSLGSRETVLGITRGLTTPCRH